jgi:hypothetical protein
MSPIEHERQLPGAEELRKALREEFVQEVITPTPQELAEAEADADMDASSFPRISEERIRRILAKVNLVLGAENILRSDVGARTNTIPF